MSDRPPDKIVWIDCEMTGLDLERDALIEVAVLVTDAELNVRGEGVDVVIAWPPEALESTPEFTALGRLGEPTDIADVVAFLAGPDSRWMTGQNLLATGGLLI